MLIEENEKYWEENSQMTNFYIEKFQKKNEELSLENNSLIQLVNEKIKELGNIKSLLESKEEKIQQFENQEQLLKGKIEELNNLKYVLGVKEEKIQQLEKQEKLLKEKTEELNSIKSMLEKKEEKIQELEKQGQIQVNKNVKEYNTDLIYNNINQILKFQENNIISLTENAYELICSSLNPKDISTINLINSIFHDLSVKLKNTLALKITEDILTEKYELELLKQRYPQVNLGIDEISTNDNSLSDIQLNDNELSVIMENDENDISFQQNQNQNQNQKSEQIENKPIFIPINEEGKEKEEVEEQIKVNNTIKENSDMLKNNNNNNNDNVIINDYNKNDNDNDNKMDIENIKSESEKEILENENRKLNETIQIYKNKLLELKKDNEAKASEIQLKAKSLNHFKSLYCNNKYVIQQLKDAVETMEKERLEDKKLEKEFKAYKQIYNSDRFSIMKHEYDDLLSENQQLHQEIEEISNKYWKRNQETISALNECQINNDNNNEVNFKENAIPSIENKTISVTSSVYNDSIKNQEISQLDFSQIIRRNNVPGIDYNHEEERIDTINIQEMLEADDTSKLFYDNISRDQNRENENIIYNGQNNFERVQKEYLNELERFRQAQEIKNYSLIEKEFMGKLIDDLRCENDQLKEKIDILHQTLNQLKGQICSSNLENIRFEEELEKLEHKNQNLTNLYQKYKNIGFNLHNEIKTLTSEWESTYKINTDYMINYKKCCDEKISTLKSAVSELNQRSSYLRNILTHLFDSLKSCHSETSDNAELESIINILQQGLLSIDLN
ncbi:hypothetical protein BCR32DRAFT_240283 [Anaeromyces robustus]|uniref:Uncharacterized protein n=1 Tax=Anaeromyces robustus TaxID=1754192 RepID=A0A1Y1XNP9_9FUNG|nr:hypothetical protein BCR32DRAFT_240283 [Anaeromyces robustus]|eukprot:ORX87295.1 hypothetical protein BCR32DRAFT_240283 [Anaeromyces robustus]